MKTKITSLSKALFAGPHYFFLLILNLLSLNLCPAELTILTHPLVTVNQSNCMMQDLQQVLKLIFLNVQILIKSLLQKPSDLNPDCLQNRTNPGSARQRLRDHSLLIKGILLYFAGSDSRGVNQNSGMAVMPHNLSSYFGSEYEF